MKVYYTKYEPAAASVSDLIDIYTDEDVVLPYNKLIYIPLDLYLELDTKEKAIILPRSSTFKRYGFILVNSVGIVDPSFNYNQVQLLVFRLQQDGEDTPLLHIPEGTRLAQLMSIKFNALEHEVSKSSKSKLIKLALNSKKGFGSTG